MKETKQWNELIDDLASLREDIPSSIQHANEDNLLIIDGNNLAYRYLNRKNVDNFDDDYIRTITSLAKSYSAKDIKVCMDFGKSYYRKNLFPEYKNNRKEPETDEEKEKFEKFFTCLNRLQDNLPFDTIKLRGVEADDLITHLVLKHRQDYDHLWIISSDKDIYQLLDINVSIFNIYSRKEITLDFLQTEFGVTPLEYRLARIIEGDTGDNIHGIEGIGPKRSRELAKKYKDFNSLLKALPIRGTAKYIKNLNAGIEILKRNEPLINLIDYHELAISLGKDGEHNLKVLLNDNN